MSWPRVKLGDVATINPRPPRDVDESQQVTFVAMASASEDGYLLASETRILSETKKGFTYFDSNDVLLAKITPCFENGKCLRPGQIPTDIGFGSTEFHVIRPDSEKLDGLYLFYLVWSEQFRFLGEKSMFGAAGQRRVGSDFLKGFEIPLPPLSEQKHIAAILDKADAIRRKRQQAIQLADDFLRAVFLDMFGDPVANPKGWEVRPLIELIDPVRPITYGILKPGDDMEGGVPYVRVVDMKDGVVLVDQVRRTTPGIAQQYKRSSLKTGDVLMSIRGHVGRLAVVPKELEGANITQDTARLATNSSCSSLYLYACLENHRMQQEMQRFVKGAAVKGINLADVKELRIPVPPIELQNKIERKIELMTAALTSLERSSIYLLDGFKSLSQKSFSGQL